MGPTDYVRVAVDENLSNNVSPNVTLVIIIDIIYILYLLVIIIIR